MAQLNAYKAQVSPQQVGAITPHAEASQLPSVLYNFASALDQRKDQNAIVETSKLMADARATWTKNLTEAQNNYQPGQDFAGQVMQGFKKYHDQVLRTASPGAKKYVDQQLTNFGSQVAQNAITFQNEAEVDGRIRTFQDNISTAATAVKADPSQFEQTYGEQLTALNALKIDPKTKGELAVKLKDTLAIAAANTMGERDPYSTVLAVNSEKTGNPIIDRLSYEGRLQVQDHILSVQRMLQSQQDHEMALQEREQKQISDDLLKDGILLAQKGQLSPQWIEANHKTFEPEAYRYMYGLLGGKDATTDPETFSDLMVRALKGEDVSDDAQHALLGGSLKLDDYTKILDKTQSPRPNWVKRGTDYITQGLAPSPFTDDPAPKLRMANAMDEWQQWVAENPKATDQQAREKSKSIVSDYALIDFQKSLFTKPLPTFAVGGRQNLDVDKTESATIKAFQDGKISQPEAARQAKLIKEWRDALQATQPKEVDK